MADCNLTDDQARKALAVYKAVIAERKASQPCNKTNEVNNANATDLSISVEECIVRDDNITEAAHISNKQQRRYIVDQNKVHVNKLKAYENDLNVIMSELNYAESRVLVTESLANDLSDLRNNDYVGLSDYYRKSCASHIPCDIFISSNVEFIKNWFKNDKEFQTEIRNLPDDDQAHAISEIWDNVQLIARAGSGKTATLVNRAYFLQKHCKVSPNQMLLLAFNKKAAAEMTERLEKLLGKTIPHTMTFHALARAIVQPKQGLIYNNSTEENDSLDSVFSDIIRNKFLDNHFQNKVRLVMLASFKEDWQAIIEGGYNLKSNELYKFRANLAQETLRGEYIKSYGEKVIANFLFEHGIAYSYEKAHYWNGRVYKPDFTLPLTAYNQTGIIIEYYGLAKSSPEYDKQIAEKRSYWDGRQDFQIIELYKDDFIGGTSSFESKLSRYLRQFGVKFTRLSDNQIWSKIKPRSIKKFTATVSGFIGRCRKEWILPNDLHKMHASHHPLSDVENLFLEIACEIYGDYIKYLRCDNKNDFDGWLYAATEMVNNGKTVFERSDQAGDLKALRYVFIDEYQDFSLLFHRLIHAINNVNPEIRFFCVGDDWQAINGFAGSNLKFYNEFRNYFPNCKQLHLCTNYRSSTSIVTVSNALMSGYGRPAKAFNEKEGKVRIVDISTFRPTLLEEQKYKNAFLTSIILRIACPALQKGQSVVLLSRRNKLFVPSGGQIFIDQYLSLLRNELPTQWRDLITISTTHSFKGMQGDVIIIIDAFARTYPTIHPNWVFFRILGENLQHIDEENRRLFYVALTRAKDELFIITDSGKTSPYLDDINEFLNIPRLFWKDYPPSTMATDNYIVRITGPFIDLTEDLKADGFIYRPYNGDPAREKLFVKKDFSIEALRSSPWAVCAKLIKCSFALAVIDSREMVIDSFRVSCGEWISTIATDYYIVIITGPFSNLTEDLKADGFNYRTHNGYPAREKYFAKKDFSIEVIRSSPWSVRAKLIKCSFALAVIDSQEMVIDSFYVRCGEWKRQVYL